MLPEDISADECKARNIARDRIAAWRLLKDGLDAAPRSLRFAGAGNVPASGPVWKPSPKWIRQRRNVRRRYASATH